MDGNLTKTDKRIKILRETRDLLVGAAFPFIIMIVFSSTIIAFAGVSDLAIQILAVVGGEALLIGAFIIFGRQNGATAYRKYILGSKKRQLGTEDKNALYRTGEYALWKGFVIGFITTVPFIVFQIVNLAAPNSFTKFILLYACGWAYFPLQLCGAPEAVNFVFILVPVGVHVAGYILGKRKEIAMQRRVAEESEKRYKKRRNKN